MTQYRIYVRGHFENVAVKTYDWLQFMAISRKQTSCHCLNRHVVLSSTYLIKPQGTSHCMITVHINKGMPECQGAAN